MRKRGYESGIVTGKTVNPQEDLNAYSRRSGVPVLTVNSLLRELSPKNDLNALIKLYQIIRREKPDIVHTNTSKAGIIGRIASRLAKTPIIVHSTHGHIFYGYYSKAKTRVFIEMEKFAARFTDKITELTRLGIEDHLSLHIGTRDKFMVIRAGVDLDRYANPGKNRLQMRRDLNIPENAIVIGWVGRFDPIKNPMMMLNAGKIFLQNPGFHLLMAGDGEFFEEARKFVRDSGLRDKITLTGHRTDIPDILTAMDIYCLTSLNEGLGRAILEAEAAGLPVIAANVGGVPEIVSDGVDGILVPAQDEKALAEAVTKMAGDSFMQKRLTEAAKAKLSLFSLQKTLEELDKMYKELLS